MAVETGITFGINPRFLYIDFTTDPLTPWLNALGKDGAVHKYIGSATSFLQSVGWDVFTAEHIREVLSDIKKGSPGSVNKYQEIMPKALDLVEEGYPEARGRVVFGVDASVNDDLEIHYNPRAYGMWLRVGEPPEGGNPFQTIDQLVTRLSDNCEVETAVVGKTPWGEDIVEFEAGDKGHIILPIRVTSEVGDLGEGRKFTPGLIFKGQTRDRRIYFPLFDPTETTTQKYFLPD